MAVKAKAIRVAKPLPMQRKCASFSYRTNAQVVNLANSTTTHLVPSTKQEIVRTAPIVYFLIGTPLHQPEHRQRLDRKLSPNRPALPNQRQPRRKPDKLPLRRWSKLMTILKTSARDMQCTLIKRKREGTVPIMNFRLLLTRKIAIPNSHIEKLNSLQTILYVDMSCPSMLPCVATFISQNKIRTSLGKYFLTDPTHSALVPNQASMPRSPGRISGTAKFTQLENPTLHFYPYASPLTNIQSHGNPPLKSRKGWRCL